MSLICENEYMHGCSKKGPEVCFFRISNFMLIFLKKHLHSNSDIHIENQTIRHGVMSTLLPIEPSQKWCTYLSGNVFLVKMLNYEFEKKKFIL